MVASTPDPTLTVIVNFFNMRREAARTLHSLTPGYQGVDAGACRVVAIDNGSNEALDPDWVRGLGANFEYVAFQPEWPSPCAAINACVESSRTEYVMVCIDGARMLSPGILRHAHMAFRLDSHPFVYTLGMHLGPKPQSESMLEGYDQAQEDRLLESVDWRADGYSLFGVSSVARSSGNGFFSSLVESNCFAMKRSDYLALGGLDERFTSRGGGLANLDFFNRVHESSAFQPVMLLGEATFHQFHGGVATNTPRAMHPWAAMAREYEAIRGRPFRTSHRAPVYLGSCPSAALGLFVA